MKLSGVMLQLIHYLKRLYHSRLIKPYYSDYMEFSELQSIVESNARSIEALATRIAEVHQEAAEERAELREAMLRVTNLTEGIANLAVSLDDDRPTILGRLSRIENKIDQLLQPRPIDGGSF